MKRYKLTCPTCGEQDVAIRLDAPHEPFCINCDSEFTLEDLKRIIASWQEYIDDVEEMLSKEPKEPKEKEEGEENE